MVDLRREAKMNIKYCKCDSCGQRTAVAVYTHLGTPVLNQCRTCDPVGFDATAQADKDAWLTGKEADDRAAYGWS